MAKLTLSLPAPTGPWQRSRTSKPSKWKNRALQLQASTGGGCSRANEDAVASALRRTVARSKTCSPHRSIAMDYRQPGWKRSTARPTRRAETNVGEFLRRPSL